MRRFGNELVRSQIGVSDKRCHLAIDDVWIDCAIQMTKRNGWIVAVLRFQVTVVNRSTVQTRRCGSRQSVESKPSALKRSTQAVLHAAPQEAWMSFFHSNAYRRSFA